eukprot:CAMPEP_0203821238 /NCGR_PEP_ID=MMETSP0115-20131106/42576_1 /ASSEMBLY_ACC=CAM_ASM_000227 /TAXON_ID=33651 /ORGANISM="Bicosoecid sp, Strain ms1" /LENGTH=74 /DNA_ID=CAMNT_0050730259 /DNA_START=55 /DNA_END=276 /DNA_ORIENTATION=-
MTDPGHGVRNTAAHKGDQSFSDAEMRAAVDPIIHVLRDEGSTPGLGLGGSAGAQAAADEIEAVLATPIVVTPAA